MLNTRAHRLLHAAFLVGRGGGWRRSDIFSILCPGRMYFLEAGKNVDSKVVVIGNERLFAFILIATREAKATFDPTAVLIPLSHPLAYSACFFLWLRSITS